MRALFNQSVTTRLGQGMVQAPFYLQDEMTNYLVRLPVNEQTIPHLKDGNCITPRAMKSGLWVFGEEEVQ